MENFNLEEYEKKLRIEHKIKQEFRDKEMSEWSNAGCFVIILFFSLMVLMKCSIG